MVNLSGVGIFKITTDVTHRPEGLCDGVKDYVPKVRAMKPWGSENPSGRFR
jgi:hypothetical protein